MVKCRKGDSPLFPNQKISEFNPCIESDPPYGNYVPEGALGDNTIPVLEEKEFELLEVFLGNSKKKNDSKVNTTLDKIMSIVKVGISIVLGLTFIGVVILFLREQKVYDYGKFKK